ncbi:PREDICTED: uridine phosphorylase 2-like [Rhagoletis zephyria]|uniref:uridine phosphorylase 2-like n=1 Tax=Rhagoletis zephyria TaxID=28612 RepID=UPI00081182B9|nr:PREDICTED: uridine phosphorylase 2-like [Rhagoletis zephyria]
MKIWLPAQECTLLPASFIRNPHIPRMEEDVLYHLGLGTKSHNLPAMFGDVKFVIVGGTPKRMEKLAIYLMGEIKHKLAAGTQLSDISEIADRYSMYKVGPILCVNHGMGNPSISILLHELIKLMHYARCKDPVFIRMGTCGGLGIPGGSVVISDGVLNDKLNAEHEFKILGNVVPRPARLDLTLARELNSLASPRDGFQTVIGKTYCADDFYEGQGRLDGAFCDYKEIDKLNWLKLLNERGVINIEMESSMFAALTDFAGIKAAIICVAILNRLNGDQIKESKETLMEWQERPGKLIARFIRKRLDIRENGGQSPLSAVPVQPQSPITTVPIRPQNPTSTTTIKSQTE